MNIFRLGRLKLVERTKQLIAHTKYLVTANCKLTTDQNDQPYTTSLVWLQEEESLVIRANF